MPDTSRWSSDQPGELVTMPTEDELTTFARAEHAEDEAKVERLAAALHERFDRVTSDGWPWDSTPEVTRESWRVDAREILEEIE